MLLFGIQISVSILRSQAQLVFLKKKMSDENETEPVLEDESLIPSAPVQFWTYLILEIPSIFCTIFLLFHLTFNKRLRNQIHNHIIVILLLLSFIILVVDNSLYLDGWRNGRINSFPSSSIVCLIWWFIDYGFYGAISVFLVWASLERHLLIFHRRHCFNTYRRTFIFHYLPLIIISLYLAGFYIAAIFFPPCENIFYFESLACGSYPCYLGVPWLNKWDYLMHGVIANILEAFFSSSLLIRTVWKKFYSQTRFNWKKYRKMTVQLLSVSTLSLLINLPQSLIVLVQHVNPDLADFGSSIEPYLFYFTGYVILLLPFICLGCLPELWPKLIWCLKSRRRIIGVGTITNGLNGNLDMTVFVRPKPN